MAFAKPFYRLPSPVLIKQAVLKGETEMTWGGFDKKNTIMFDRKIQRKCRFLRVTTSSLKTDLRFAALKFAGGD